jgi:cytochrome b6-f complex iron-sulfur subunit
MSDEPNTPTRPDRRRILDGALALGACGAAAAVAIPAARFATPPEAVATGGAVTVRRDEVLAEGSRLVQVGTEPVLVVALPGGGFRAFGARCTHLGCTVRLSRAVGELVCPCHGGRFDLEGRVLSGPPPGPLAEHDLTEVEGAVVVEGRRPWSG